MDSTQRTRPRTGGSPIGLVVFIILTVVFAALAYWSFAKYQSVDGELAKVKVTLTASDQAKLKVQDANVAFTKVTGVDAPDSLKPFIKDALDAAKAEGHGEGAQETAKDTLDATRSAITEMRIALNSANASLAQALAQARNTDEQKKSGDVAYEKALADRRAEIEGLNKKLAGERADHQVETENEREKYSRLFEVYGTDHDSWRAREIKGILHVAALQQKLRELSGEGAILEEANGYITEMNLRDNLATVNIGANAGVRPGMRFVAFSKDAKGAPIKKGVVEVVRATDNVSVGRVIFLEQGMVVGKNDFIYNLAGPRKKTFVFAGTPKLYTIEQWTNVIRANAGDVVEDVRKGDQVADYLILGEFDEEKDAKAKQLIFDARDFGLKIVKEADLKNAMGMK